MFSLKNVLNFILPVYINFIGMGDKNVPIFSKTVYFLAESEASEPHISLEIGLLI